MARTKSTARRAPDSTQDGPWQAARKRRLLSGKDRRASNRDTETDKSFLRSELISLLQRIETERDDRQTIGQVVDILCHCPELAQEKFRLFMEPSFKMPLSIMAASPHATKEQVKTVYELHPAALSLDTASEGCVLIASAIRRKATSDVIEFMARACPEALQKRHFGMLPIHVLLERWAPPFENNITEYPRQSLLELFLDLFPESIHCASATGGGTPLEYAISIHLEYAVELMLKRFPTDVVIEAFNIHIDEFGYMEERSALAVQALSALLPQVRALVLATPEQLTEQSFCLLMKSLQEKDTSKLETLTLSIPREIVNGNQNMVQAFQEAVSSINVTTADIWMPKATTNGDVVATLLSSLSRIPSLTKLTMSSQPSKPSEVLDITDPILMLLHRGTLEEIYVRGFSVKVLPVCEALKTNTCLRRFGSEFQDEPDAHLGTLADVIEKDNVYLESIDLWDVADTFQNIFCMPRHSLDRAFFLTALNKQGRASLRDPSTSTGHLIELLVSAKGAPGSFSASRRYTPGYSQEAVIYGLLRENPNVWLHRVLSR